MSGKALIVGAGPVGESTALRLRELRWDVRVTSRDPKLSRPRLTGVPISRFDLQSDDIAPLLEGVDLVVMTPILTLSTRAAPALGGRRVIAFSSNNVAIDPDAPVYRAIAEAERAFLASAPQTLILRPTLIYGHPHLKTLTRIMRWAQKWPVLPLPGTGRARQQPVFHDDLGRAAAALAQTDVRGAIFTLAGPDIVSMRDLFARIAAAVGKAPTIAPLPAWALNLGASALGPRFPFDRDQIARLERDRIACPQTPLPDGLAPRTDLSGGLAQLAAALARQPAR
ncbi:MAG: hypothetical protein ABUS57_07300 [Pseudomonadota bacterium]